MISEKKTSPTSSLDRGTFRCRTGAIEFRQHTTSDSPCSSSATLVDDDHLQADVYKLILSPENQQYNPPQGTGDSPERRTSQSSFNPNATPFVPSRGTFPASQAHPIECGSFTPGWLSSFWEGTTTAIPAEQELHAKQMIDSCATPSTYGPFARAVYDALNETCGTWESSCFRFYLQKSAFDSFNHSWSAVTRQENSKPDEIDYAFRISCFVAELHAVDLFPRNQIHHCLGIVISTMHSIEDISVIWEMIVRAKGSPWQGPGSHQLLTDFTHFFSQWTQSILAIAGSRSPASVTNVSDKASDVLRMIREWHNQPSTHAVVESVWTYCVPQHT